MKAQKNTAIKTVLTISVGFGIIFLLIDRNWALHISLVIGLLGLISNKIAQGIEFLWMKLSKILSHIIPNVVLGVIFYFFLFPIAILSRIFRQRDTLKLKKGYSTTWVKIESQITSSSFEKMW